MIGPILSAGASLLGGFLQRDAQKDANAANAAQAAQNIALQREFAQNSIQWKAADAEKAGIHPIYAMGAPTASFSPVTVGATAESGLGTGLQSMGQDLSRSVGAYRSPGEKVGGVALAQQTASNALDLETKNLNNTLLRAKIAQLTQPATPPGVDFPVPEKTKPEERPPLMAGGSRWLTNPNTSPQKAWADQYGDEGPASWITSLGIMGNDVAYNIRKRAGLTEDQALENMGSGWSQVSRWLNASRARELLHGAMHNPNLPVRPTYPRRERR